VNLNKLIYYESKRPAEAIRFATAFSLQAGHRPASPHPQLLALRKKANNQQEERPNDENVAPQTGQGSLFPNPQINDKEDNHIYNR